MSTLNPVGQLVAVIQSRLAQRTEPARPVRRRGVRESAYAADGLTGLIELRVAQIAAGDPQRGRKALRVFLEAVLLSHFGAALANDGRFHQMVDDVQRALEADPACASLLDAAIRHLLASGAEHS